MTLLGFWLQSPKQMYSYPDSFEVLYEIIQDTDKLMKKLHEASYELVIKEMREFMQLSPEEQHINQLKKLSDKAKAQKIQEAIYYSGDYAYDYEYIHFLPKKYKYDYNWLLCNKSFDIYEVGKIALKIKEIINKKKDILNFTDRNLDFKEFGYEIEDEFKIALEFATYINLIPEIDKNANENTIKEAIVSFCNALLDIFTIDKVELNEYVGAKSFLENFTYYPKDDSNSRYCCIGDYNILQSKPIIYLENNRYFIPIVYQLFVSIYESPFYWIMSDKHYEKTAGSHRGKSGEDMAYELIVPVFGEENVLRDIEIKDSKHHTITDIDTLCLIDSKAICFQIKSKRLSQTSRNGSLEQLTKDFRCAVQDAYEQGLICRKYLLNNNDVFFWSKEKQCKINISSNLNDIYIICLTSENYPALTHQVHELLSINDNNPIPIVFSIFDLRLITHYLDNPYKFTYYIRQRIQTNSVFYSDNEINYLAYHLLHKLHLGNDYNRVYLANDFACEIDKDYYPYISGKKKLKEQCVIKNKCENPRFESLCKYILKSSIPNKVDVVFFLYDLSSESRDKLIESIDIVKQRSLKNNTIANARFVFQSLDTTIGITTIAVQTSCNLQENILYLSELHKYYHKADKWLTIGVYNNTSASMIDVILYIDRKWTKDDILEEICKKYLEASNNQE